MNQFDTLRVNGQKVYGLANKPGFDPSHLYKLKITGNNQPIDFYVEDSEHSDNTGSYKANICTSEATPNEFSIASPSATSNPSVIATETPSPKISDATPSVKQTAATSPGAVKISVTPQPTRKRVTATPGNEEITPTKRATVSKKPVVSIDEEDALPTPKKPTIKKTTKTSQSEGQCDGIFGAIACFFNGIIKSLFGG